MVKAKKHFGQHFLHNKNAAEQIVQHFLKINSCKEVLEIGAGTGSLTSYLLREQNIKLFAIDIDRESIQYLQSHFPEIKDRLIEGDFLKYNLSGIFENEFSIIGNFPYNISTQILFRVLEYRDQIPFVCGMFQKEVGDRIAAPPGSKTYGILSVLMQAYFDISSVMTLEPGSFTPPPKVRSSVLMFRRRLSPQPKSSYDNLAVVVKAAFNQRRKTLRNALKSISGFGNRTLESELNNIVLDKRAEQLSWQDFDELCRCRLIS